jgi:hypothetical protein
MMDCNDRQRWPGLSFPQPLLAGPGSLELDDAPATSDRALHSLQQSWFISEPRCSVAAVLSTLQPRGLIYKLIQFFTVEEVDALHGVEVGLN